MNASKLDDSEMPEAVGLELIEQSEFYVAVGDVVAEKYRVESVLGVGGMGFVLSAKHVELEERFALKFLNEQFLQDETIIERFTQEAKAACRIRSEHVARVYDVGVHGGAPFLVMEHLRGRDLATIVAAGGALRIHDAVEYTMQACEALAVAHRQGIVHRDIKPENLFLVEHEGLPSIKVLDFGISKLVLTGGAPASRLTGQLTLGTPCYMSPEQIRSSASADARSDLWSLGVVLYELLSGTEAFRASTVTEVCAAVLEKEPETLSRLRPEIPRGLADVVAKCLAKDPDERFANVAELAVALLPFAPPRALVSAERSSSLMRGARRAGGEGRHISSVRPSKQPASSSRHLSLELDPAPRSDAPFARSVEAVDVIEQPRFRGRRVGTMLALGGFAMVTALGVFVYPAASQKARSAAAPAAVSERARETPSASAPVAIRAIPTAERSDEAEPSASSVVAKRSTPRARPAATSLPDARTAPSAIAANHAAASASALARAVPSGSASAKAAPSGVPSTRTAPTATGVELGY